MANVNILTGEGMHWELRETAAAKQVHAWLEKLYANFPVHQTAIVVGALLNGTNAVTQQHRFGKLGSLAQQMVALIGSAGNFVANAGGLTSGLNSIATRELNAVADELKNPNIEGIPIHADTELETSDVDVSQKLLIYEVDSNKDYRVDSSVPRPRTWNIKGYLMSNANIVPLESKLVIKPSLIAQRELLQWFVDSRKPVLYKTHDNRFYSCLITRFESQYSTQALNALAVNISLQEFKVMKVNEGNLNVSIMQQTEEIA